MVKKLKIKNRDIELVFKSKYPKPKDNAIRYRHDWRKIQLGFFYERSKIVGKTDFSNAKEWKNNLVNSYMFGVNLIIFKMWFTICKNGMIINLNKEL